MISNVYHSKKLKQEHIEIEEHSEILNQTYKTKFSYFNPVTFLFPELLQDGKINLNKTISFNGIIFHLLFKIITILIIYLKHKLFITNSILFVILGITSFDFWVVKNYSGKKLIGITWITFRDDNSDLWYFERINKLYPQNKLCKYIFWYTLYIYQIILFGYLIMLCIKQNWEIVICCLIPTIINLIQTSIFTQAIQENELFKYLQDLTEYRLRRSVNCKFNFDILKFPIQLRF